MLCCSNNNNTSSFLNKKEIAHAMNQSTTCGDVSIIKIRIIAPKENFKLMWTNGCGAQ